MLSMHRTQELREQLTNDALKMVSARDEFIRALGQLQRADPSWERWYDECLPEWTGWLNAPTAIIWVRLREIDDADAMRTQLEAL
jgi:hypothetical protein